MGDRPSPDALIAMGFPAGAFAPVEPVTIYPGHETAFQLFRDISSQWLTSMGGFYALDYSVAYQWMNAEGIKPRKQNALLRELAHIEDGALQVMKERREEADRRNQ